MPPGYVAPFPPLKGSVDTPPGPALRIRVRWHSTELDVALAGGADPIESEELEVRAKQLDHPRQREQIAESIDDLLGLAAREAGPQLATTRAAFSRDRIQRHRSSLTALAERLRADESHAVKGLAMANLLLEDASGPIYAHQLSEDLLGPAIEAALSALRP